MVEHTMAKIAWFPAHPAQVWLMHTLKKSVENTYPDVRHIWVVRDKDIVLNLLDALGQDYVCISRAGKGFLSNGIEMLAGLAKCLYLTRKCDIDLWFTKYGAGNIAARLMGRKSISFNDDDVDIVPLIARTSYPFADKLIFPKVVRSGKYQDTAVTYDACHELVYLHPSRFSPDRNMVRRLGIEDDVPYFVLRLSALSAHHDHGAKGISEKALDEILRICEERGVVPVISSERTLPDRFKQYAATLAVDQVHHALAFAELYAGDSQSMALEAAVLGTPALRFSDFSTLSIVNEFERYGLIQSFKTSEEPDFVRSIREILSGSNRKEEQRGKWQSFISQKEDPLPVFIAQIALLLNLP